MELNMEQIHNATASFARQEIDKIKYPPNHPFNEYPSTPESMVLELIVLIKALTNNDNMVRSFLKKCKSVENGNFSNVKYNQNTSEVIWFYYLYTGLIKSDTLNSLIHIYDEDDLKTTVYFADPHSPWQCGSNENINDVLRLYFHKGLGFLSPFELLSKKCCT